MFLVMDVELSWCFMSSWTGKELRKSLNGSVPSVESLSVPDSVVELGEKCFENCKNLRRVTLVDYPSLSVSVDVC